MKGCSLVSPILTLTTSITHLEHPEAPERVTAVHASCVQVYVCVISLFAYISKSVYAHACIVCINIPSVNLSLLMRSMCQYTKLCFMNVCSVHVFVCVQCVSTCNVSTSSCPSGAAMLFCSASSLIAPISLWFCCLIHIQTHIFTDMCALAHWRIHTQIYTTL